MKITISGFPGSGKSTIGRMLAKRINFQFYSIGDLRRKMAFQRGLTLEEFNRLGEHEEFTDKEADDYIKLLAKEEEEDFILDGRMGFYFIPESTKILIIVAFEEGANRIFDNIEASKERNEGDYKSYEETLAGIKNRVESDIRRYNKYYQIENCYDKNHFDIVIDTTNLTIEEAVEKIAEFLEKKKESKQ